jgi:DNA-nicking Smr family endonuclease
MRRTLRPDELKLWSAVAATVRPAPGRIVPRPPSEPPSPTAAPPAPTPAKTHPVAPVHHRPKLPPREPDPVEPGRKRLLTRERVTVDARLDLHGLHYDRARAALRDFIARGRAQGWRHVLVITGKGPEGFGVLRQFTPVWLAEPGLREHVAGVSQAHRRHGGEGALYVALKART